MKIDINDLSPAVQKIYAFKGLLWGIKSSNIFCRFLYVLLSVVTKLFALTICLCLSQIKRHLMGAMMLKKTSIDRPSSKAVAVCKGGLKFDKNDLSPAV